jgi:hypothetical protein
MSDPVPVLPTEQQHCPWPFSQPNRFSWAGQMLHSAQPSWNRRRPGFLSPWFQHSSQLYKPHCVVLTRGSIIALHLKLWVVLFYLGFIWRRCQQLIPPNVVVKWLIGTPASHLGGPGFKSRPWRPAILIEGIRCFPQSHQANAGIGH